MAASAAAAPGSAERQARGGAASAIGNAVTARSPRDCVRLEFGVRLVPGALLWLLACWLAFWCWDFWVLACGMSSRLRVGGAFHGWAGGGLVAAACTRRSARARMVDWWEPSLLRLILPLLDFVWIGQRWTWGAVSVPDGGVRMFCSELVRLNWVMSNDPVELLPEMWEDTGVRFSSPLG